MEPLSRAWARMKTALFKPFDIHRWFVVGFNAFLAGLMDAANGGGGSRFSKEGNFGEFIHFPATAWSWLMDHPGWAIAILFGVLVAIAVVVVLTWVSSRGVFMFVDNVVRNSVEIAKPWREYQKEGNSLFVWRLLLGIASFAAFGLVLSYFFVRGAALYDSGVSPILPIGFIIGLGLVVLGLVLVWGYIVLFLKDFVAALMYRNRISCGEAWRLFLDVFRKYPFHFVGYGLIVFLLMIIFVIAVVIAGLATCCIGWILLAIPYISTVVTLPAWYAYRGFSLEFLAQFGPEFDAFKRQSAGEPATPAAPAAPAV
jgi:hypothetical protein